MYFPFMFTPGVAGEDGYLIPLIIIVFNAIFLPLITGIFRKGERLLIKLAKLFRVDVGIINDIVLCTIAVLSLVLTGIITRYIYIAIEACR